MARTAVKPFLISRSASGEFLITVRTTRFNSQGYPLVSAEQLAPTFPTAVKARSYLREEHRAEATDIATV